MTKAARTPVTAYIALGANLGDPVLAVRAAIFDLAGVDGVALVRYSSLYRSTALGGIGPDYVNAVVEVTTVLSAFQLLDALQRLEDAAGRQRPFRNAPRTLDLDLLLYGDTRVASARLVVPHPRMQERAFVLVPLAEIAPHRVDADRLRSVQSQFLARL